MERKRQRTGKLAPTKRSASRRVTRSGPRRAEPIGERASMLCRCPRHRMHPCEGMYCSFFIPYPPYTPKTRNGRGMGPIFRVPFLPLTPWQKFPRTPPRSSKIIFLAHKSIPGKFQKNLEICLPHPRPPLKYIRWTFPSF